MKRGRVLSSAALALLLLTPAVIAKDEQRGARPRVILAGFVNKTNEPEWIEYFIEDQSGERVRYVVDRWVETPRRILEELVSRKVPGVALVDRAEFDREVVRETRPASNRKRVPAKFAQLPFLDLSEKAVDAPAPGWYCLGVNLFDQLATVGVGSPDWIQILPA